MTQEDLLLQYETRRHFFSRCGVGVGKLALLSLLNDGKSFAAPAPVRWRRRPRPRAAIPAMSTASPASCVELPGRRAP